MADDELIDEIACRARVSRDDAVAMLEVLAEVARKRLIEGKPFQITDLGSAGHDAPPGRAGKEWHHDHTPTHEEVQALITRAQRHPLGMEFLMDGELGSVAITFQTHAFTVDAARALLRGASGDGQ